MIITEIYCDVCKGKINNEHEVTNTNILFQISNGRGLVWTSISTNEINNARKEVCPICMTSIGNELKKRFKEFFAPLKENEPR